MIGNDIVDLDSVDFPAYHHVNYLERVCTPWESRMIRDSEVPSRSLAIVWASKEAAYKSLSKRFNIEYFVPKRFESSFDACDPLHSGHETSVSFAGIRTKVVTFATDQWVHAIATYPAEKNIRWKIGKVRQGSSYERQARNESEIVRSLTTALLLEMGRTDLALEFTARIPTLRRKEGGPSGIDISLSHHGAYAAVAIGSPSNLSSLPKWMDSNLQLCSSPEVICSTCTA